MRAGLRVAATALVMLISACATTPASLQDYFVPGRYTVVSRAEGPDCTVFRPESLSGKHPIILWGNGTVSKVPAYTPLLSHWASQGFVVAAANTNSAGSGAPLLACLDYLTQQNAAAGSVFRNHLDLSRVGASGHSQGGGGTIMAARDPRITATAPIEAYTLGLGYVRGAEAGQHGAMLLLSGGLDTTAVPARNQKPVFDAANTPVFWATLKAADHAVPATGTSGAFRPATTAWFRWKLMGDKQAGRWFEGPECLLCKSADWTIQRRGG